MLAGFAGQIDGWSLSIQAGSSHLSRNDRVSWNRRKNSDLARAESVLITETILGGNTQRILGMISMNQRNEFFMYISSVAKDNLVSRKG